jgi:hypothetical protein
MLFRFFIGAAISVMLTMSAQASVISTFITGLDSSDAYFDFRNGTTYAGCDGLNACTRSEGNANGRGVLIFADTPVTDGPRLLYRDNADGFGIKGHENDEIDADEFLTISFDGGWQPTFLGLTDLFKASDGGPDGEEAIVRGFRDNALIYELKFDAVFAPRQGNGEGIFTLPGVAVDFLEFHSVEDPNLTFTNPDLVGLRIGQSGDEFSVAFIAGTAIQAPEPGSLALFGLGLAGFGFLRRRKF